MGCKVASCSGTGCRACCFSCFVEEGQGANGGQYGSLQVQGSSFAGMLAVTTTNMSRQCPSPRFGAHWKRCCRGDLVSARKAYSSRAHAAPLAFSCLDGRVGREGMRDDCLARTGCSYALSTPRKDSHHWWTPRKDNNIRCSSICTVLSPAIVIACPSARCLELACGCLLCYSSALPRLPCPTDEPSARPHPTFPSTAVDVERVADL